MTGSTTMLHRVPPEGEEIVGRGGSWRDIEMDEKKKRRGSPQVHWGKREVRKRKQFKANIFWGGLEKKHIKKEK